MGDGVEGWRRCRWINSLVKVKFVFWQNIISPHQSSFVRSLAERGHDVTVVAPTTTTPELQATGWTVPDLGRARVVIGPDERSIDSLVGQPEAGLVHVLAGARVCALGRHATRLCLRQGHRMGILTEAPDPRGLSGLARWGKYALEWLLRGYRYDFVMGMGEMGVRWFRQCGYQRSKVFPFCYVVDELDAAPPTMDSGTGAARVLFVGRLVALKGVDDLLRAVSTLRADSISLRIVGDGAEKDRLVRLAKSLPGLPEVEWVSAMPNKEARASMSRADLLVLPSRKDGWGAVVNEALMAGTPVVCSSACGAADLLREPWLGAVCKAGDVSSLSAALGAWAARGRRTAEERGRVRTWTASRISGRSVAEYFQAIMEHLYEGRVKPEAPWRF